MINGIKKSLETSNGITLIALVITIIVLLILAGISISMLTGENSLINNAKKAKEISGIAGIEEAANIEYAALTIDKYSTSGTITLDEVVAKLEATSEYHGKTYSVASTTGGTPTVELSSSSAKIAPSSSGTVTITVTKSSSTGNIYYAIVDGKYYLMSLDSNGVSISKTGITKDEADASGGGTAPTYALTPTAPTGSQTTFSQSSTKNGNVETITLTINTGSNTGEETITVTYGESGKTPIFSDTVALTIALVPEEGQTATANTTFNTSYGKIDIIWLDTSNNEIDAPLSPATHLQGSSGTTMKKVYWGKADGSVDTTTPANNTTEFIEGVTEGFDADNWYNYTAVTSTAGVSRWANAYNPDDESYFVWIPRYAYRITYYASAANMAADQNATGYYDGYGQWTVDNGTVKVRAELDDGVETVEGNDGNLYIVHPAFTKDDDIIYKKDASGNYLDASGNITTNSSEYVKLKDAYDLGGWSAELSGIWVAKYEMSREDSSDGTTWSATTVSNGGENNLTTNAGNTSSVKVRVVSKPGVTSWRKIHIKNCFANSYNYDRTKESHLMKNSEWGAVAYLAHSKYGLNGTEITINNNGTTYYTAGAQNATATTADATQGTTKNAYGIFDLSGNAYEYVASFDTASTNANLTNYGWADPTNSNAAMAAGTASTKYATAYSNGTSTYSGNNLLFNAGKVGDATKEVNIGGTQPTTNTSYYANWNRDYGYFVYSYSPFFLRGGYYLDVDNAGLFYSSNYSGYANKYYGFRVVLCP